MGGRGGRTWARGQNMKGHVCESTQIGHKRRDLRKETHWPLSALQPILQCDVLCYAVLCCAAISCTAMCCVVFYCNVMSCHVMSWSARAIVRWSAQWASIGRTSSRHTHTHSDGMGPM